MTCREVRRELCRRWFAVDRGGAPDLADLQVHLVACAACRAEAETWAQLHGGLAGWPDEPPPADLVGGVMAAVAGLPAPAPRSDRFWRGLLGALVAWLALAGAGGAAALVWAPGSFAHMVREVVTAAALGGLIAARAGVALAAVARALLSEHPLAAAAAAVVFIALPLLGAQTAARRLRTQG